jgi:aspartyl-tRNA(Asn)/glutamyl-tRNA(Gln) amidotransferase subunit B
MEKFFPTIGLEIHVELKTKTKMFCSCLNDPEEKHPNINICPICLGHPGTLPVINEEAVKKVIKVGLALNCEISKHSFFERKNYFYPDLPKGYQISQYQVPLCKNGFLEIDGRKIRIRRVHLEEDTGRLLHQKNYSLVDFNRAGVPLMELVTEPDIKSAKEARKFAQELQLILRYLGVSDADMEKGQMRIEANVSLSKKENELGTKVEIKNLNSFKAVEEAIEYEIARQTEILKNKKKVIQETRGWDDVKKQTFSQREKEEAKDYRYFPEPDLPPLEITPEMIASIQSEIPELPQQRRERFKKEYQLDEKSIEIFVQQKELGEFFEKVISELPPNLNQKDLLAMIKLSANYIISDLLGLLKERKVTDESFLIDPENFAEFITLINEGKISSKIAKIVLEEMFKTGKDPDVIIEEKQLVLIGGEDELKEIAERVISENQKAVSDFKAGKKEAIQFLVGQMMAKTKGRAHPQKAREILLKILNAL